MRHYGHVDVSILIVSYNTREMTRIALDTLAAETNAVSYEVIVIDNASSDGSAEMIACHPLKPQLVTLRDNIGFARANNLAANLARGRYILLLNPDTEVLDGAIDKLVAFARAKPQARIWGGRTVFADGSLNPSSCWGRMTLWNLICRATGLSGIFPATQFFNGEAIGGWRRDTDRHVDIVSGCFFLIEKELWDGLRGFDPLFFMYGEEADLCLRAHAFSARPMVTPEATIIHHGGASEKTRAGKMVHLLAAKASLIDRHWQPAIAPLGRCLLSIWPLSRALAVSMLNAVSPSPERRQSAQAWAQIWARRTEWQFGYPEPAPSKTRAMVPSLSR